MSVDAPPSPVIRPELTPTMKGYIVSKLEDEPSMVAQLAYSRDQQQQNSWTCPSVTEGATLRQDVSIQNQSRQHGSGD
jgi:hypothetical protein